MAKIHGVPNICVRPSRDHAVGKRLHAPAASRARASVFTAQPILQIAPREQRGVSPMEARPSAAADNLHGQDGYRVDDKRAVRCSPREVGQPVQKLFRDLHDQMP